jgi:hypothetical protein
VTALKDIWIVYLIAVALVNVLMRKRMRSDEGKAKLERGTRVAVLLSIVFPILAVMSSVHVLWRGPSPEVEKSRRLLRSVGKHRELKTRVREAMAELDSTATETFRAVAQRYETDPQPDRRTVVREALLGRSDPKSLRRLAAYLEGVEQTLFMSDVIYCLQEVSGCGLGVREDDILTADQCAARLKKYDAWAKGRPDAVRP